MGHFLEPFDTSFKRQPSTLQWVCTPKVPARIGKRFPINFSVITYIERINSGNNINNHCMQSERLSLTCGLRYTRPADSSEVFVPHFSRSYWERPSYGKSINEDWQQKNVTCDSPLDPTLLPPSFVPHFLGDPTPEDVIIKVFPLLSCHLCDDACQFFLLFLFPMTYRCINLFRRRIQWKTRLDPPVERISRFTRWLRYRSLQSPDIRPTRKLTFSQACPRSATAL